MKRIIKLITKVSAAVLAVFLLIQAVPAFALDSHEYEIGESNVSNDNNLTPANVEPEILYEDVTLRSENTKHFKMNNGTYLAVQYARPVHEIDSNNEWVDIDSSYIYENANESDDGFSGYINRCCEANAKISDSTDGMLFKLSDKDEEFPVSFSMTSEGLHTVAASITDSDMDEDSDGNVENETAAERNSRIINEAMNASSLLFSNAYDGADIVCRVTSAGVEQDIIICSDCHMNEFSYAIDAGELTATVDSNGYVNLCDESGEIKYSVVAPYIYDSEDRLIDSAEYVLTDNGDGIYELTVIVDMDTDNTAYPVTLRSSTVSFEDDCDSITDRYVSSYEPDQTYNGSFVKVGQISEDNITRSFINLREFPELEDSGVLFSAKLYAYRYYTGLDNDESNAMIEARMVTDLWDTDTVTWNDQPEFSDEPLFTSTTGISDRLSQNIEWDITELANDWYENGEVNGIALVSSDEANSIYYALDVLPYITVNYVCTNQANTDADSSASEAVDNTGSEEWKKVDEIIIGEDIESNSVSLSYVADNDISSAYAVSESEREFREVNGISFQYCIGETWTSFNGTTGDLDHIDGVKIQTGNRDFYFRYYSKNTGVDQSILTPVYSTKSGSSDYAGLYNHAMTNLSIEVYTADGTRVYDDYVVMYRVKVADKWLEWVSNGQHDIMSSIKDEFDLNGGLDYDATNAGWEALGCIQALEIRMFERKNISSSGGSSGNGDFQNINGSNSGITMEYRESADSPWVAFTSTASFSSIEGIRLQTLGKPYYFRYAAKDAVHGWSPYVSSWNSGTSDYAGYTYPITNIAIEVHTSSARVYDNFIVMYRAKVDSLGWLPWVSNGQPGIMESIMPNADLDTSATDAGDSRYGPIRALEIQIYEREGLIIKPGPNATIIEDVPYINQKTVGMINGCESVSAVMALQYIGVSITPEQFVTKYLDMGTTPVVNGIGPDPGKVFLGDPRLDSGWGCYAPVIMKALNKISGKYNFTATDISGQSLSTLCSTYIDNNIPVIMWATVQMKHTLGENCFIRNWTTTDGTHIEYNNMLHALVLIGYDDDHYFFNDPLATECQGYSKANVEAAYDLLGKQAIVITKNGVVSGVETDNKSTVSVPSEVNKMPSLPDEKVQDPIDLSTGAHVVENTLMTIYGAQTISLKANYRSNLLVEGSLGVGWSHNFEKKLTDTGDTIRVYDSPTYFAEYNKVSSDSDVYTTSTPTKNNYTVTKTSNGYVVNCNYKYSEYYGTDGNLTKIKSKSGLNTLIEYPDANTEKIIDEISGRYILITKNTDGKIESVTDNTGRTCILGYIDGCLTSIRDENNNIFTYLYNDNKQIARGMDSEGTIYFTNTYDVAGRIIRQKDACQDGFESVISYDETSAADITTITVTDRMQQNTVFVYNEDHQLISKTDPNGIEVTYEYDANGNLTKKTDGLGNSAIRVYDGNGNLTESIDRLGRHTVYTYDAHNNLTSVSYPGAGSETYVYDGNDRPVSYTDMRGYTTAYEYNSSGLLIKAVNAAGTTEYEYVNGLVSAVTDRLGRRTVKQYNDAGFLTSVTDAQNGTTSYTYDNKGNVLTVTDACGNITAKEYDSNGNIIRETNADGYSTQYTYNGNLKMTSMTLPTEDTIHYKYDGEDRLIEIEYPDGSVAVNEYDAGGRVIRKTDRDGNSVSYEYDAAGNVTKITNAEGGVTNKEYDAEGNVIRSTEITEVYNPYGSDSETEYTENVTTYTYGENGRLIKTVNPAGGETVYTYNNAGDLLSVTDPLGNMTANTYDVRGNLVSVTDPRGNTTSYTYDSVGNLLTVTNALGQTTTNTYDSANRLVTTTDPGGHTTSYTYDELGRMTSCTDARGNTVHRYYDALGNVIKITNESNHIDFEAVYDRGGRAVEVTDAAGSRTVNSYDWEGNLTGQTNALGETSSYTYNGAGQVISSVDKAGKPCYATYDGMGNLTSMTGPNDGTTVYEYNSTGQLNNKKSAWNGSEKYIYNALGLKSTVYDAASAETSYTYDAAGRLTGFTNNNGTTVYTYDANGNVLTSSDSAGTVTREYDALNRVTKYTDIYGNVIEYQYDVCGNLVRMIYPTGEEGVYTYDGNHNMLTSSVEDEDGEAVTTTYEYNKQNRVKKIVNADGSVVTKSYDSAGRLQVVNDRTKTGQYISVFIYNYDALGRIVTEQNPISMEKYTMTYDSLGRLINRTETDTGSGEVLSEENFTYDDAGNITDDGTDNVYTYDTGNRLMYVNNSRGWTNVKGNQAKYIRGGRTVNVGYDARNRLKTIDGSVNEYWYDADNNRVNMYDHSTNMQYTYDCAGGRSRLVWTNSHLSVVTTYAYGAEGLIWSRANGEYQVYHYDYRGSVIAVTDIDGNITDTLKYDAYGKVSERTGNSSLIFGYNGRYGVLTDPSGLLYMRTRYYSPDFKRFMSADIIDGSITDSTTLNVFAYVNGNPISFVDPFGLSAERGQSSSTDIYLLYSKQEIESKAADKIRENSDNIKNAAEFFNVDFNIVAAVVFVEQYFNYDWMDELTDRLGSSGINTSVGLGQVRMQTAKYIEQLGLIDPVDVSCSPEYLGGLLRKTEDALRYERLMDDGTNLMYVAAYLKSFQDDWSSEFPKIAERPDILGSLYNLGHTNNDGTPRKPHSNPQANWFGEKTQMYYDLMPYLLGE